VTPSGATPSGMAPRELLAAARDMLQRPASTTAGLWPRAAALLARQALEQALDGFWRSRAETAALVSCKRATQLACLSLFIDDEVAGEVAYAWSALSNACHYHPYDLAPTAVELDAWMRAVGRLLDSVA
jgi:hypothetical protein